MNTGREISPVGWLPAGLVSWYTPGGQPVAMVVGWMALICGPDPRLRVAWPGRRDALARFWPGGDFVLNVPGADCLARLYPLVDAGTRCLPLLEDLGLVVRPGSKVKAPRLWGCPLQFECQDGCVASDLFEPEVVGRVVLLHRNDTQFDPSQVPDLCAINPFATSRGAFEI